MWRFSMWEFDCDRQATQQAYSSVKARGADTCICRGCRNFVLARDTLYPPQFLELLKSLGIDPLKDAEVYHIARLIPEVHE